MSNTPLKCIMLIIRRIYFGDLLDCPLFAIKPPFHPKSSRCSFSECLYTKHFPKHALLDLLRSLMPRGKVNRFRGKARHFPRKKGLCTHGRCWKYEEKCYKKDCNENLKLSICKKLYICAKKVKGRKVNLL